MKKNYEKEYDELKNNYDTLELEYKKVNSELYYIKQSRLYKMTLLIRKFINPIRNLMILLSKSSLNKRKIIKFIKNGEKLAIIPCSFEFDEFVNQRPINYAKYLSDEGYKVIYIAWQWNNDEKINKSFQIVHKDVMQVPLYDFLDLNLNYNGKENKVFFINFPNEVFSDIAYNLRSKGFFIHYDIMDEWEEFKKVGQADWYQKVIEEKIINESDYVSAVSPYLVKKFAYLRTDIELSPNGFYKKITGYNNENISLKKINHNQINIGYFGHLTDSWFDWDLLIEIAQLNSNYVFHLIGYGLPDNIAKQIEQMDNIIFYGKVPTNNLYKYVKNWNIGIILFKNTKLAKAVDPIKIYEYLYMGLPVIVSGINHLKDYPQTFLIKSTKEFSECVEDILTNRIGKYDKKFINNSTWESRFDKFLKRYEKKGVEKFYED